MVPFGAMDPLWYINRLEHRQRFIDMQIRGTLYISDAPKPSVSDEIRSLIASVIDRGNKNGVASKYLASDIIEALEHKFSLNLEDIVNKRRGQMDPPLVTAFDVMQAALEGVRTRAGLRMGTHGFSDQGPGIPENYAFHLYDDETRKGDSKFYTLTLEESKDE
jgi:hypothetical protein